MWFGTVSLRELIDLLEDERADADRMPRSRKEIVLGEEQLGLVWRVSPKKSFELPVAILVNEPERPKFFAWAKTYLGSLRPITAQMRVLTPQEFGVALAGSQSPALGRARNACVGLILGELQYHTWGRVRASHGSLATHIATHSFAMARCASIYGKQADLAEVSDGWFLAREFAGHPHQDRKPMQSPWSVLARLDLAPLSAPRPTDEEELITRACREINETGIVQESTWRDLGGGLDYAVDLADFSAVPREKRVVLLEPILRDLAGDSRRVDARSLFAAGYLLSQVAPGSFEHTHLVPPESDSLVLLWYGLCAGLHPEFRLGEERDPIRRMVVRELSRGYRLLDYPRADIGLGEMRSAHHHSGAWPRHLGFGFVEVEILPGVSTFVGFYRPSHLPPPSSTREQRMDSKAQGHLFHDRRPEE